MDKKVYVGIIVALILVVIGMGVKMLFMNTEIGNLKNEVESTKQSCNVIIEAYDKKCPGALDFNSKN